MNYEIKITGSGTKKEIIASLQAVAAHLELTEEWDGVEWEGPTLFTEVNEDTNDYNE